MITLLRTSMQMLECSLQSVGYSEEQAREATLWFVALAIAIDAWVLVEIFTA